MLIPTKFLLSQNMTHWPVKSSKTRQAWPSARRLTAVQSVSIVCTTAAERTSMLSTTRIWAREKVRRLTAGVLTYVTEVEGIGRTYAIYHPHTIYHNANYRKNEKLEKICLF